MSVYQHGEKVKVAQVGIADSLRHLGQSRNSPGQNTKVGSLSFSGIFLIRDQTEASHIAGGFFPAENPQGSPRIPGWVAYPFSGSSRPRIEPGSPSLQVKFFTD